MRSACRGEAASAISVGELRTQVKRESVATRASLFECADGGPRATLCSSQEALSWARGQTIPPNRLSAESFRSHPGCMPAVAELAEPSSYRAWRPTLCFGRGRKADWLQEAREPLPLRRSRDPPRACSRESARQTPADRAACPAACREAGTRILAGSHVARTPPAAWHPSGRRQ